MRVGKHSVPAAQLYMVLLAAFFFAALMLYFQSATPYLPGFDSYYHAKMAYLVPELGFTSSFPWMYWTPFREGFVNHYYGFHLLASPFMRIGAWLYSDLLVTAKAFDALMAACLGALLFLVFHKLRIRWPLAWVLLMVWAPWHFWLRMAYIRAPLPNLCLLLAGTLALLHRKKWAVFIVAFCAAHLYSGGLFFIIIPFAFVLGHVLCNSLDRLLASFIAYAMAGFALAFVTSPYFPANLSFLYEEAGAMVLGTAKHTGSEWEPYDTFFFMRCALPFIVLWCIAIARRLNLGKPASGDTIALAIVQSAFLLLTFKSRHFIEYWPPFFLLHIATLARPVIEELIEIPQLASRAIRIGLVLLGIVLLAIGALPALSDTHTEMADHAYDFSEIRKASQWLEANSEKGALVFNDDWDIFPHLFFCNHHNHYMWGLDPIYTKEHFPAHWRAFELLAAGEVPTDESLVEGQAAERVELSDISTRFKAAYVVVTDYHTDFYRRLSEDKEGFILCYPPQVKADEVPAVAVFESRGQSPRPSP